MFHQQVLGEQDQRAQRTHVGGGLGGKGRGEGFLRLVVVFSTLFMVSLRITIFFHCFLSSIISIYKELEGVMVGPSTGGCFLFFFRVVVVVFYSEL